MPIERVEAARLKEWARRGEQLDFKLDPSKRRRLAELMFADATAIKPGPDRVSDSGSGSGSLEVTARFSMGANRIVQLEVTVSGQLDLICQRCLSAVEWPVVVQSVLSLVEDDDQAQKLQSPFDSALLENGELVIADVVEDEILATMPLVPSHAANQNCEPAVELATGSDRQAELTHKPFADLDALVKMRTNRTDS